MEHTQWLESVTDNSVRATAKKIGLAPRTLATQLEKGNLSPENVIAIAIAYGHHPVGALVDTGYLDEKWAHQVDPVHAIRTVSEDQLADEVLRRMKLGKAHGALDTPIDELTERRAKKSNTTSPDVQPNPYDDGTVTPWDETQPHAADHSPDEDQLRWKEENPGYDD